MLTSIRKTTSSIFVKLLFVLLIASFAIWGIGDVLRTSPGDGPIEVGDRTISLTAVDREFRTLVEQQSQAMGFRLTPVQGIQFGLLDQAISNLVSRALIDQLAAESGVRVDDDTIRRFIRDEMGFKTEAGAFDRAAFEQWLAQPPRNMTEQVFVDQLRYDIARDRYLLQSIVGGVRVPEIEAGTLRAYREETRAADFVRVAAEAMPEPEAPTDAALQTYYEAQTDAYMAPEYRTATALLVDPDALADSVEVDEEQLNEEFLYRQDTLRVPERRAIEQMILGDAAQAEAAAAALAAGQDFAAVAAEVAGQDPAAMVMGTFSESEWFVPEVADALFGAAEAGVVTEPVDTPLGWRIYRLAAIEPPHDPTLDEVRDELSREVALRVATDMVFDLSAQVQDEIAGGQSLAQAAATLGLEATTFGPVSAEGLGPDDGEVEVPGGDAVLDAVFAEDPGVPSGQYDLPNGGVFFVEVGEVTEPTLRPLEAVRDQVLEAWTAEQKLEAATALAQSLYDAVASGTALSALAEEHGLELQQAEGIRRDGQSTGGLPGGLAGDLFALEPGEAGMSQVTSNAIFVAQLTDVTPAPEDAEAERALWLELSAQATSDVLQALGIALQRRVEPTVQNETIRQTFMTSYGS